jgi:type IV pilus assembly protein PilC
MAVFQYVARTRQGKMITGRTEAADQSTVARMLREQGLIPTSIEAGSASAGRSPRGASGRRGSIKIEDMVIMSRQFSTMIRAGLPLLEVLNILGEQAEKRAMRIILKQVERDVETGSSLTESIQKHPRLFNTFYVSMVKAGEASGMLDTILDQVAGYLEKVASIQRKVKSAVMYPAIVSIIAILITVFLLVKVVPVFRDIFAQLDGELPMVTRICVAISEAISNHFLMVALGLIGAGIGIWQAGKTRAGRKFIDAFKLKMPIFGPLFLKVAVARFTRTLGVLIRSGVNILNALDIVAKTANNSVIEAAVMKTRASIQSGETISAPLRESEVFPPMVVRMIDVGERTGALESMLTKIADFYEDQVDAAVAGLTALIEPLLIVFLGLLVGFIAVAMFLPLFKMVEQVG